MNFFTRRCVQVLMLFSMALAIGALAGAAPARAGERELTGDEAIQRISELTAARDSAPGRFIRSENGVPSVTNVACRMSIDLSNSSRAKFQVGIPVSEARVVSTGITVDRVSRVSSSATLGQGYRRELFLVSSDEMIVVETYEGSRSFRISLQWGRGKAATREHSCRFDAKSSR